jgi:hypothetical protein
MALTITFDPALEADVANVRLILDTLTGRDSTGDVAGNAMENTDISARIADDLLSRLGEGGRELFAIASEFDRPFSLPDLAARTGDTVSKIKSRWANLGRSIAQTRSRFGNIQIFVEQIPAANSDGYFTFLMEEGIRNAVRQTITDKSNAE